MNNSLFIITGASRGLGLELALKSCRPGSTVVGLSRGMSDELASHAFSKGALLLQWQVDLSECEQVAQRLENWLMLQNEENFTEVTLINNAGTLGLMAPLEEICFNHISRTIAIGLEAPIQLTSAFIRAVRNWSIPKNVLNISSGMGRRAQAGSSLYGASKAGLDHFSRCVALDEARRANGVRITSLAPGIIDTDMQKELRASDPVLFPDRDRYIKFNLSGALKSAGDVAENILFYLHSPNFAIEPVTNLVEMRDLPK